MYAGIPNDNADLEGLLVLLRLSVGTTPKVQGTRLHRSQLGQKHLGGEIILDVFEEDKEPSTYISIVDEGIAPVNVATRDSLLGPAMARGNEFPFLSSNIHNVASLPGAEAL